jgi:hypothetical protein
MLGGGAWRLLHQSTFQICTRKIKKPFSLNFAISHYKSPKKGGIISTNQVVFIVDFYFSIFFYVFVIPNYLFFLLQHYNIILCIRLNNKVTKNLQCYFDMEIMAKVQHKD